MAVAIRYEAEVLLRLRESPLCIKPKDLPPREEWMGPPPEPTRPQNKTTNDRGAPLEQGTRRPTAERHVSRNGASSDGIILGPPRMSFSSSTLRGNNGDSDRSERAPRDPEARDRFLRSKIGGDDVSDRFRDARQNDPRRRGDGDRDGEGWSTVKPRKSFGQEGAERFTGRMGGERQKDDRRAKERDEHDSLRDRPRRNMDTDGDEGDAPRRNGLNRGRSEPWFKDNNKTNEGIERSSNRERIDKAKSWRDRNDRERNDRERSDRHERRWEKDRDQRASEREPEWLDEPAEEKSHGHTEADLKKFMETMKASKGGGKAAEKTTEAQPSPAPASFFADPPAVKSAPAVERGPDKFFEAFAGSKLTSLPSTEGDKLEAIQAVKAPAGFDAPTGKSSRFANLFSAQAVPQPSESRGRTEPSTPAAGPPPPNVESVDVQPVQHNNAEKEAFQALLQKLHLPRQGEQQSTPTPPNAGAFTQPPPPPMQNMSQDPIQNLAQALAQKAHVVSPQPSDPYGMDRREEPRLRSVPPGGPEILAPRPMPPPSQPPSARPDQMLQDLLSHRHNAQSQGSGRAEHGSNASRDFLMQLMQSGRHAPEQPRIEQIMRMPQPQRQASLPHFPDREPDFLQQRGPAQRQMRPQGPPGFADEQFRHSEGDGRPLHPTQILQRPPGLDHALQQQQHQQQQQFMQPGQQMPPVQRPMIPPPGLMGQPRNGPVPGMFNPANMPPGVFPPDTIPGPPRNMQPPPGFFGGGPPPPGAGHMMMGGFPGPDGMVFGAPFDGRGGMPPPGAAPFRR
ncbi:hypothetical protein J7T55_010150 [Diaporthe amygdali]|uniref:uncharacterized protein n=1 Tax=Phomopsis amygdali TaxID=1214568 RepID=UPI0022FECC07|nr:uncharacterized protein J7T55_010150 [Diaporthe amygdali]KAJ0113906.1 hypothetical protein J7T55_010150 [Diaporthe amygdali]